MEKPLDKDVLNELIKKSEILDGIKTYVLYSKSGFADEIWQKAKAEGNILLYSLENF